MASIPIQKTMTPKPKPDIQGLPFGKYFTDHMFLMDYVDGQGWINPRIVPYGPFSLDPGTIVFHYAQEIFEGLKAYAAPAGGVQLFRPAENVRRLNLSAERMCIPPVPEDTALSGLKELIALERDWVPTEAGASLYIRPFIFATEISVGVHPSRTYTFCIITCPVGSYYPEGVNPVKILIETEDVRAVRGGTGYVKCGGNYAASIRAGGRAAAAGFSQVLWLDGLHRKYVEEVGSMNVMFKIDGHVITPELSGSVLGGITRKSVLALLQSWGVPVAERLISVDELIAAADAGKLEEAWGTGTAAVISPIGEITYEGVQYVINGGQTGPLTQKVYDNLTGIQWGTLEDPFGWTVRVC